MDRSTLLLRHTNSTTTTTSSLGMLTTHTQAPVVTQTTVRTNLLQPLQIVTQLRVDTVCENLRVLAINDITLSVEEPGWNFVLGGVLDDGNDALEFFGAEITSTIVLPF